MVTLANLRCLAVLRRGEAYLHGALQIGAVIALVAYYLVWLDRTQIWVQNYLNENGSNVADLYAALRRRMRTRAAGPHSTSPTTDCISITSVWRP